MSKDMINMQIASQLAALEEVAELKEQNLFSHLRRQLVENQDLQDRKNMDGHVTSSFLLLDPTLTKVLMIFHKGFGNWFPPGGHYEGFVTLRESALRELEEETGFPANKVRYLNESGYLALDLDTHPIPARPSKDEGDHWHHDFLFIGVAKELIPLVHQVEEVEAAEWMTLEDAAVLPDERVRRGIKKAQRLIDAMAPSL